MSEERRRVLEMLAEGRITVADAEALLSAMAGQRKPETPAAEASAEVVRSKPRYLRVTVEEPRKDAEGETTARVNICVPLQLLRAGIKLGALLPQDAQVQLSDALEKKGIRFSLNDMPPEMVEEFIDALSDLTVDVNDNNARVRVFCES